jgi:pyrimidine deaminase RibD-like protein
MDKPSHEAFETLCEREFALQREDAYTGLDREIAAIRERHNALGTYVSSATGQAVRDAVLARFDRIMAAFEEVYLGKWRADPVLPLTDADVEWLTQKAGNHLNVAADEAEGKCNTYLGEPRTFFAEYWCAVGIAARERSLKVPRQIEIMKLERARMNQSVPANGAPLTADDYRFALMAVEEARKSIGEDGRTHPKVGAVIVSGGQVLAAAHRGEIAGCHAEYIALERKLADTPVAGATVYTTLEPCTERNHPKIPCARRLVERKVRRVVIGTLDPNPAIRGHGVIILREANIVTELFPSDLMAQVEELNRDFIRSHRTGKSSEQGTQTAIEVLAGDRFFEQLRGLAETGITKRLWQRPHWRILIRPAEFMEAQFRDASSIRHFLQHAAVQTRNWDYPCVKPASIEPDEQGAYVAGELDLTETKPGLCERWVLFRSGQFVHNRAIQELPGYENELHYLEVLRLMSEVFEFAKRMAKEGILSPKAVVKVSLRKASGLGLLVPDSFEVGKGSARWCKQDAIDDLEMVAAPADLETRSYDLALDAALYVYKKFGWSPDRSFLAEKQPRFS